MDAARSEPRLRDLEATTLAEQDVARPARARSRSTISAWPCGASSKPNTGSMRSTLTPGVSIGTRTCDCCACVARVGIGLAHHDEDLAARVARARRPPLAAVDDVVIAVAVDAASRCWWHPTRRPRARSCRTPSGSRRSSSGLSQRSLFAGDARSARGSPCCRCRARSS